MIFFGLEMTPSFPPFLDIFSKIYDQNIPFRIQKICNENFWIGNDPPFRLFSKKTSIWSTQAPLKRKEISVLGRIPLNSTGQELPTFMIWTSIESQFCLLFWEVYTIILYICPILLLVNPWKYHLSPVQLALKHKKCNRKHCFCWCWKCWWLTLHKHCAKLSSFKIISRCFMPYFKTHLLVWLIWYPLIVTPFLKKSVIKSINRLYETKFTV